MVKINKVKIQKEAPVENPSIRNNIPGENNKVQEYDEIEPGE